MIDSILIRISLRRRMRCVDNLQQEKGRIILDLEREEEMLTNGLQKKLEQVKREKALLEQQIKREEKAHAQLQNKFDMMVEGSDEDSVSDSGLVDLAAEADKAGLL